MNKIEVKSKGIVIGYTYDEGKTIEFLSNSEADKIKNEILTGTTIGISAQKFGTVNKDNNINITGTSSLDFIENKE